MLLTFDESIVRYLNGYAAKSEVFDRIFSDFLQLPSVKFLPIVTCLVWLWFDKEEASRRRIAVVQALLGTIAALLVSRLIQDLSPHLPRPIHSETLNHVLPSGIATDTFQKWSSFPSDTTAMAFALATGIWMASRPLGWGCLVWAAVIVSFPRIYLGFHYPSDILAGALLGVSCTLLCSRLSTRISGILSVQEQRLPALFYSCSFIILYQIVTIFDDLRHSARGVSKLLSVLF